MQTRLISIWMVFAAILVLFIYPAYGQERYASVYLKNGDRLTGRWLASDDRTIQILFQEKKLSISLDQVSTIRFAADLSLVPDAQAEKHFRNGKALLELGLREEAKKQFEAAIAEFPKYADAHYNLGLLLKEDGIIDEALDYFGRVARIAPDSYDLASEFKAAGDSYLATEAFRKAADAYLLIFNHYPTHSEAAHVGYAAGFILAEQSEEYAAEALKILQEATQRFPESDDLAKAEYIIGTLQLKVGQPQVAVETLTIFIRESLHSKWIGDAHEARGDAYRKLRMNDEALEDYLRAYGMTTDSRKRVAIQKKREECAWTVYTVSDSLPSNNIQTIAVNGADLWVGTPKGLARIDVGLNSWQLRPETGIERINRLNPNVPTNVRALAVYTPTVYMPGAVEDAESALPEIERVVEASEVWIGTLNQGVVRYNPSTESYDNYNTLNGLPHNQIFDIEFGPDSVWVATFSGVARYSRSNDEWTVYDRTTIQLPVDKIVALAVTPETVWAGTENAGVTIFDLVYDSWRSSNLSDMAPEVVGNSIASFDVADHSVFFTWYSQNEKKNGFGHVDWKGLQGSGTPVLQADIVPIENIYIAVGQSDPTMISPPFWIATNDAVYFKSQRGWDPIGFPVDQIGDGVTVNCIELSNETAWIGTSNGLAKIDTNAVGSR